MLAEEIRTVTGGRHASQRVILFLGKRQFLRQNICLLPCPAYCRF